MLWIAVMAALAGAEPGDATGGLWVDLTGSSQLASVENAQNGGALHRAPDGLFYVTGIVNGVPVRFLVDTGASTTVLTHADALHTGVLPSGDAFRESADTANGPTRMATVVIDELQVGTVRMHQLSAAVASDGLTVSLLGQSWLARLNSLTIAGDSMIFRD